MINIKLVRVTQSLLKPQIGVLLFDGEPRMLTLELPEAIDNTPSCIPEGSYLCEKVFNRTTEGGTHIPLTLHVLNVPHRTGILFHVGNTIKDTLGCILVGQELGVLNFQEAVLQSKNAFQKFTALIKDEEDFTLEVTRA